MDIVIAVAAKIAEYLVAPIGRQLGYLCCYDTNLGNLSQQLKDLYDKKDWVHQLVNDARRKGGVINPVVESWQRSVNEKIKMVSEFEDEVDKKRACFDRWSLSRKAQKITQLVLQLQKDAPTSSAVSHPAPPPKIWSTFEECFKAFESRMTSMNEVIQALHNEDIRMIGICGMGGVGKTTMAKEIIKKLGREGLFDNVAMAVVSQQPNVMKIQSEIAQAIGPRLEEDTESGRALTLNGRLKEKKRILIVLDDVWSELNLEAIGLPSGHKGCKVLLTSRDSEVCNRMGSQKNFALLSLTGKEPWDLFRETVGPSVDHPDLCGVAREITDECGGLPIALVTVGKALENKEKYEWDDALTQLRASDPVNISEVDPKVYSSIKLSFDKLDSDQARSCLFHCCLFPEDYNIPIEQLVRYGWARGSFGDMDTVEAARNRVRSLVDKLRRRFLLLDSKDKECVKMHDIVRDVAISIASRGTHGNGLFMIRTHDAENKGWPKKAAYNHYTAISLSHLTIGEVPDGFMCPKLELLQLESCVWTSEFTMDSMCKGMKELKVLALLNMECPPLPSLGELKNLKMLCLDNCKLKDISSAIGGLENLEILSFADCKSISDLPSEIGLLNQLRLLDMTNCRALEKIPRGVFSSLTKLEELYMRKSLTKWEHEILAEVFDHQLKVLSTGVYDANLMPKDLVLKNLPIRFQISFGKKFEPMFEGFEKRLTFWDQDARKFMENGTVGLLLKKAEILSLRKVDNLKYVLNELDQEGFQRLKELSIGEGGAVTYLINGANWSSQHTAFRLLESVSIGRLPSLEEICHDQLPGCTFTNLRSLQIDGCELLTYGLSLSVARNLKQLQSLSIWNCGGITEIVSKRMWDHENEADRIDFPKLTKLGLVGLSSLVGFYQGAKVMMPKDDTVNVSNLDKMKGDSSPQDDEHELAAAAGSSSLFNAKCISWLQNLETLSVRCPSEEVDVLFDLKGHTDMVKDGQPIPAFSQLQELIIPRSSGLAHLWVNIFPCGAQLGFQNLRVLKLEHCYKLKYVFPPVIAKVLGNLEKVDIEDCKQMESIVAVHTDTGEVAEGEEETGGMILFPKLKRLRLGGLLRLERLCPDACTFVWPSTKEMDLFDCPKLKTLGSVMPQTFTKLESEEIDPNVVNRQDSTAESGCGSGCGCRPPWSSSTSRADAHRRIQILPRPLNINEEVSMS